MANGKRKAVDMDPGAKEDYVSPFIPHFESFRTELDEHHDRRERIIKASRDITALSKKIIFALQRVRELGQPIHPSMSKQTAPMYTTINTLLEGLVPDLQSLNVNRYHPNISGGLQEFMEAVLFQHYLETQTLLSHEDASRRLPQGIRLTQEDYLLGLFDTTGELMRFAITYIATNGRLPASGTAEDIGSSILGDMQALRTGLEALDTRGIRSLKDFDSKMKVTRASVEKVENGVYSMLVRGKERPKGWRPDTGPERRDAEEVESY